MSRPTRISRTDSAPHFARNSAIVLFLLALAWTGDAARAEAPHGGDAIADDAALDGPEIYRRVLRNRFRSYTQETKLVSGDRGARDQETRLRVSWQNMRDDADQPVHGIFSKTRIEYTHPFDIRFTTYLVIDNADRPNDQFVYLPSRRRVRRVNLRGEAVFGTDLSFEDVIPREVEHSTQQRLTDGMLQGVPVFVVEATPKPGENSEYSRFVVSVEKRHFVPIETRYYDLAGIEIKRLEAPIDSIREFDGIFIPMRGKMTQLQLESFTDLTIQSLTPNPVFTEGEFDLRRLESH